jgi:hypothetical protein
VCVRDGQEHLKTIGDVKEILRTAVLGCGHHEMLSIVCDACGIHVVTMFRLVEDQAIGFLRGSCNGVTHTEREGEGEKERKRKTKRERSRQIAVISGVGT